MPDDSVKNISIVVPTTPVQEHPQNVSMVPRRRFRQDKEEQEKEGEGKEESKAEGTTLLEDKVTISTREFDLGTIETEDRKKEGTRDDQPEDLADTPPRRIDIKV